MPHTLGLTDAALMRSLPPDCETVWKAVLKLYIGKMPNENKTSDGADISDDDEHSKRIKLLDEGIEWVRIKSWANLNLTVAERNAANKLGYTRNKWDSGFGIRTLRETLSQCDKDGKNSTMHRVIVVCSSLYLDFRAIALSVREQVVYDLVLIGYFNLCSSLHPYLTTDAVNT